ncbi:hypothetical protein EGW08_020371 [Elysia chlorotica]|uniref:BED-type domain-containing protein n=1 Tax=Elysia chlorotica TaxID=188477 RepID=A0A433SRG3_ELYCH|nr:hypothetical protein EGW08_020371 [Elysia chlorotica]
MLNMPRDFSVNYCEINDTITDQVKKESSEQGGDDVVQGKSFSNRKPSIVWSFMIKENSTSVKCQLCNHQFKFDGSTSPMLKHLKVRHKGEYSVILREGALPAQATPKVEIDVAEEEDKSSSEKECAPSPQTRVSKKKSRAAKSVNPLKRLDQYGLDQPRVGVASKRSLAKGLSKKPVSIVWSFMIREAPHKIKCTICNHEFKENGSTSPMLKHIKRRHEEEYKALMEEESLTAQKESASTVQMDLDEQENVSDSEKECVRSTRTRLSKKNSRVDKSVSALKKLEKDGLAQVRTNVNLMRNVIKNSSGKPVNIVWRFMIRENWKTAKCKICNGQLKYHGTIAALRKHLKRKHAEEFAMAEEEGTPFMSSKTVPSAETSINQEISSAETSSPDQTEKSVNATKKLEKSLEQPKINVDPVRSFTYNKFGRKPVSIVWKFMIRENPNTVKCKICNRLLKYHGGFTSPLRKHLKRMHHEEFAVAEEGGTPDISSKTVPSAETGTNQETTYVETSTADQTLNEISNSEEVATLTEKSNSLSKKRKVSPIWKYMLRVGINKTMCRLCKRRFNYFNGCTSHMHKHIQRNHPEELGILKVMKRKEVKNFAGSSSASNFLPENVENSKNQEMTDVETSSPDQTEKSENAMRNVNYNKFSRKPVSIVWRFIIRENRNTVRCKICHRQLKYAGFTSPLHKHLKRMHQEEFAVAEEGGTPDMSSKTVPSAETGINQEISSGETSSPDQTEKSVNATKKLKKGLEQPKIDVDPVRNVNYNKFRRKVVSIVWTFMIRESHNTVKCTICNRQMKYDSSAMRKHLRRKHQQEFAMAEEERTPFMSSKTLPSAETGINQEILSAETSSPDQTRKSSNASTRLEQGCFEQSRVDVEQRTAVMERGSRELEPADEMDLDEEDNLLDSDEEYLPNSLTKHSEKKAMVEKSANAAKSQRVGVEPKRSLAKGLSQKPVSIVWSFMIREAPHIVKCKICNHEFKDSPTGSTSTMLKHLRRRHLEELTAVEEGGTLTLPRELESVVEAALDEETNMWDSDEEYLPNSLTKHLEKKSMKEIGLVQARINVNPMRNVTKNFSRKPVSIVWRFMIRENHNRVKCTICNRQMKYDWSAMRKHLKRKHQQEFAMAEEERTSFMSSKTLPSAETGINREIVCVKTGSADKLLMRFQILKKYMQQSLFCL